MTIVINVVKIHIVVTIEIVTTIILVCWGSINKSFCRGNKVISSVPMVTVLRRLCVLGWHLHRRIPPLPRLHCPTWRLFKTCKLYYMDSNDSPARINDSAAHWLMNRLATGPLHETIVDTAFEWIWLLSVWRWRSVFAGVGFLNILWLFEAISLKSDVQLEIGWWFPGT